MKINSLLFRKVSYNLIPTGSSSLYCLFFLINFAIVGDVGTTFKFRSSTLAKTFFINKDSNSSSCMASGIIIFVKKTDYNSCDIDIITKNKKTMHTLKYNSNNKKQIFVYYLSQENFSVNIIDYIYIYI